MNYEQNYYNERNLEPKNNVFHLHPFYVAEPVIEEPTVQPSLEEILQDDPAIETNDPIRERSILKKPLDIVPILFHKRQPYDYQEEPFLHEVIPIINNQYFRFVLRMGDQILDVPGISGDAPIHQAVEAKDPLLVEDLLQRNLIGSINFANNKGMTPLMLAVETEMESIVELLLKHGAASAINQKNPFNLKTALHMAATLKSSAITRLLLKYGAEDSITMKDRKHYTPIERAIITKRVDTVKAMLEIRPEIAKRFNRPDFFNVTDIHRAGRSGSIDMMSLLLAHVVEEEIKVGTEASFTAGDLEACRAKAPTLYFIPIEQVAFPLTIAQNYCQVMVALENGKILRIPNADAQQVRNYILQQKYGNEAVGLTESNVITFYLSPGHGFLRLECQKCDDEKPHNMNHGFYPTGNFFATRKYAPKKDANIVYNVMGMLEEAMGDQKGTVNNENWYEDDSDSRNSLKIMFYVDDNQAKAALDRIKEVAASCKSKNPEIACLYNFIQRNCVDFIQEIFVSAGGKGNFAGYFTDEQLNYGYLESPTRLYEFKAMNYAYLNTRGFPHYLRSGLQHNINNLYNTMGYGSIIGKDAFMQTFPLPHKFQTLEPADWNIRGTIFLGMVLAVGASKVFNYFSDLWLRSGETVSNEFFVEWKQAGIKVLESLSKKLDEVEDVIDGMQNEINEEIEALKKKERKPKNEMMLDLCEQDKTKWKILCNKRIDLLCDLTVLNQEMDKVLNSNKPLSKAYLDNFAQRIEKVSEECKYFIDALIIELSG